MSINKIHNKFKECKDSARPAFIAYVTAGDPDFDRSLKIISTLCDSGIDILELGIPYSDPLADGEANQEAAFRALKAGMTPEKSLDIAAAVSKKYPELPIVLFTYLNPLAYSHGLEYFSRKAADSGVDSILALDMPPEESGEYLPLIKNRLSNVSLVAPKSTEERIKILAENADSFIYYVSREGVTGEGDSFSAKFADRIELIRKYTELPVVVGFGISTPEHVRAAASAGVDGVVVGSAIVRRIQAFGEGRATLDDIKKFVSSLTAVLKE